MLKRIRNGAGGVYICRAVSISTTEQKTAKASTPPYTDHTRKRTPTKKRGRVFWSYFSRICANRDGGAVSCPFQLSGGWAFPFGYTQRGGRVEAIQAAGLYAPSGERLNHHPKPNKQAAFFLGTETAPKEQPKASTHARPPDIDKYRQPPAVALLTRVGRSFFRLCITRPAPFMQQEGKASTPPALIWTTENRHARRCVSVFAPSCV